MEKRSQLPDLTSELIDQIIYAMENQRENAVFNPQEGIVSLEEGEGCIELPPWRSSDGFNLMTRFATRVHSAKLKEALGGGHGVFRAFKNVLDQDPVLKQKWLSFKRHEMEKVVTSWWRRHGAKEQEMALRDVLLEDFSITFCSDAPSSGGLLPLLVKEAGFSPSFDGAQFLLVHAPDDSLAALSAYRVEASALHLFFYGVDHPWRGLGLFRLMVESLSSHAAESHLSHILFDSYGRHIGAGSLFDGVDDVVPVAMTLCVPVGAYLSLHEGREETLPYAYL